MFFRIKEKELAREQQKLEKKKDGEEILRLQELHLSEQKEVSERRGEQKRLLVQAHQVSPDMIRCLLGASPLSVSQHIFSSYRISWLTKP